MKNLKNILLIMLTPLLGTSCLPGADNKSPDAVLVGAILEKADTINGGGGLEGFKTTVYAFTRANCKTCHGTTQIPLFASDNVEQAYDIALGLVNFSAISMSRFVAKVKDRHCGAACSTDGAEMTNLITQWKGSFQSSGSGGLPTEGQAVKLGNIFTAPVSVPAPNPASCILPTDLRCGVDGLRVVTINGVTTTQACTNTCWTTLKFPVSAMTPRPDSIARAWFQIDFAYENYNTNLGAASYVLKNPRIVSPDFPAYIFDVKFFLNQEYRPHYGEFMHSIDKVVDVATFGSGCTVPAAPNPINFANLGSTCIAAVAPLFSTAASAGGIIQEREELSNTDKISFSFEYLQKGISGECKDIASFQNLVFNPITRGAVACLNCHRSAGQVSEAAQRFNMDPNDIINGSTAAIRMMTICKRFLQRSNFEKPEHSAIIVQPQQGLNGMPPQDNFNFFAPDWIDWVLREARP